MKKQTHVEWLNDLFSDFEENNWAVADCDEVRYFIDWVNENKKSLNSDMEEIPARLSEGKIVVSQSTFDSVGEVMLRKLNGTPNASIIIVDDKKFSNMTASERANLLY